MLDPTKFKLKNRWTFIPNVLIIALIVVLLIKFLGNIGEKLTENYETNSKSESFLLDPEKQLKEV